MAKTIGNPLSWMATRMGASGNHISASMRELTGEAVEPPVLKELSTDDIRAALRAGWQDFLESRTDVIFIVLIYPLVGLLLIGFGLHMNLLPLLFPLMAGFVLLGPVAAVGLYEISRRREAGEPANWLSAVGVIRSPSFGAVVVLGIFLSSIFLVWMLAANAIHAVTLGPEPPASVGSFLSDVFLTGPGWAMIILGLVVGFFFALAVLATSVVSFPLLLDRHVGVPTAIMTSVQLTRENPRVVLTWGAIVAGALVLGTLPALIGLIIVMPVLGHATWHFYRRAIQ